MAEILNFLDKSFKPGSLTVIDMDRERTAASGTDLDGRGVFVKWEPVTMTWLEQ